MTNGWIDIKNTDMMLIMGGNPAENHPCGFKWAIEAKIHRNAKTIVVDPRLTRTAANADLYVQIRAGSDIAFLGGVIRYAIENNRIAKTISSITPTPPSSLKTDSNCPDDGLFSGFDPRKRSTTNKSWNYEEGGDLTGKARDAQSPGQIQHSGCPRRARLPHQRRTRLSGSNRGWATAGATAAPQRGRCDLSLQHPRCVFNC